MPPLRDGALRQAAAGAALVLFVLAGFEASAKDCPGPCGDDRACASEAASCFMDHGSYAEAVKALKPAHAAHPRDGRLARLLALAYLRSGNRVWATRTLLSQLEAAPEDLQTRTWTVWLLIQDGDTARAKAVLEQARDPGPGAMAERLELLGAILLRLESEDDSAEEKLRAVKERGWRLFPEDVGLYEDLRSKLVGDRGDPFKARILVSAGYTTNATQSAPQDAASGEKRVGSPVLAGDLVLRLEPWVSRLARPLGEIRSKGLFPTRGETQGLGYLDLGGRAGGELGRTNGFRFRALYGYELLGLLDDGWYMEAHRGELEVELPPWFLVFGGAGRRIYQHRSRTRTEMDLGGAFVIAPAPGWSVTTIVGGRMQFARHEAFDGRGATLLARLRVPIPRDMMVKARGLVLYDGYPHSENYYGERRRDLMVKGEVGFWSPDWHGLRIGATYIPARRFSTIDTATDNFDFVDHRALLQLRWQGAFDPTLPRKAPVREDHVPLPYGVAEGDDGGLDRVQDLLRQEDSARRGSSCVD
jgi:Flp pilus assembly protein TadD